MQYSAYKLYVFPVPGRDPMSHSENAKNITLYMDMVIGVFNFFPGERMKCVGHLKAKYTWNLSLRNGIIYIYICAKNLTHLILTLWMK